MASEIELGISGLADYKEIGSGGFADVYSATEADNGRTVAVKILTAVDEAGRRRFDRERQTMGLTTEHPHIVTLFRSGYTSHDNKPFLVMEYLSGGSLEDRLMEGPIPWPAAIELVAQIADALDFSHSAGIVHKDVKPANILSSRSGASSRRSVVKLSDFGIAAIREATATSQVAFSLLYTPPEIFVSSGHRDSDGKSIDPRDERSDLYSLGATLFTLGMGAPPFQSASQQGLIHEIISSPAPKTGISGLDDFFGRTLAKDPEDRFPTAAHFLRDLESISVDGHDTVPAPAIQIPAVRFPESPADTTTLTVAHPSAQQVVPRRWKTAALLVAVGSLLVASLYLLPAVRSDPANPEATSSGSSAVSTDRSDQADSEGEGTNRTSEAADGPAAIAGFSEVVRYTGHRDGVDDPLNEATVYALAQLDDGRIVSGSQDQTALIWDPLEPGRAPRVYLGHTDTVDSITLLPDGRIASASWDTTVQIWDPDAPDSTIATHTGHSDAVWAVAALSDGRIASASKDGTVQLWDPSAPSNILGTYMGQQEGVTAIAVLASGLIASGSRDGTVHVWNPSDPSTALAIYRGHTAFVLSVVGLADGRVASGSSDGTVQIWDPAKPEDPGLVYEGHLNDSVFSIVELADGRIASAGIGAQVWSPSSPETVVGPYYGGSVTGIRAMIELKDGRLASAFSDGVVEIWDPDSI